MLADIGYQFVCIMKTQKLSMLVRDFLDWIDQSWWNQNNFATTLLLKA